MHDQPSVTALLKNNYRRNNDSRTVLVKPTTHDTAPHLH